MGQEKVTDVQVFQATSNAINRNVSLMYDKCSQSLSDANHILEETQEELANSNRLLQQAMADENMKLIQMHECEAEVAESTMGLPETAGWHADAMRRLAIAVEEYEKAVAHRILMEQRVEQASRCVMIATEMSETLIAKYNYGQNQISHYAEVGISRLNAADKATTGYVGELLSKSAKSNINISSTEKKNNKLTIVEKKRIQKETGWSDVIVNNISNMEQYEILKNANLMEMVINERTCLIKKDLDFNYVDPKTGNTNRELMKEGKTPYDYITGEKLELHHLGQKPDSPFVELCENSEHGEGNHSILHDNDSESWRRDSYLNNHYNNVERPKHWIERERMS